MTAEAQVSLLEDLTAANEAYRAGKPTMSDNHYDRMLDVLARTDPGNKFLHTVEPEKSDRQKVKLPAPMLSTEKAYTVDEIDKFHERIKRAIQDLGLDSDYVHFAITHKLDGMAAHWDGEKLLSRGVENTVSTLLMPLIKGCSYSAAPMTLIFMNPWTTKQ